MYLACKLLSIWLGAHTFKDVRVDKVQWSFVYSIFVGVPGARSSTWCHGGHQIRHQGSGTHLPEILMLFVNTWTLNLIFFCEYDSSNGYPYAAPVYINVHSLWLLGFASISILWLVMSICVIGQAGTQFWDESLEQELRQDRLTAASIDRSLLVI